MRILAGVILVLSIVPWWLLAYQFHSYPLAALIPLTLFGAFFAVAICHLFDRGRAVSALVSMGAGSMGLAVLLFAVYLPQSQPLRLPLRVADVLIEHGVTRPGQAVMFEYKEPSLAFYQGGTIREYDESLAALAISTQEAQWAVIPKWVWDQATPATRSAFDVIGPPLKGLDYSDALKSAEVMVVSAKRLKSIHNCICLSDGRCDGSGVDSKLCPTRLCIIFTRGIGFEPKTFAGMKP